MSSTRDSILHRKLFARINPEITSHDGERIRAGSVLESAIDHAGNIHSPGAAWMLSSPKGESVKVLRTHLTAPAEGEESSFAFECLLTTIEQIRGLESPMEDTIRARIGAHLIGALLSMDTSRTIREMTVGELCDVIEAAKAPCFII